MDSREVVRFIDRILRNAPNNAQADAMLNQLDGMITQLIDSGAGQDAVKARELVRLARSESQYLLPTYKAGPSPTPEGLRIAVQRAAERRHMDEENARYGRC